MAYFGNNITVVHEKYKVVNFDTNASSNRYNKSMQALVSWTLSTNIHNTDNVVNAVFTEEFNNVKQRVEQLIGKGTYVYTSGASESNMSAVNAMLLVNKGKRCNLVTSSVEHMSNKLAFDSLGVDHNIFIVKCDKGGHVTAEALEAVLVGVDASLPLYVSIIGSGNESGAVNDIIELGKVTHRHGGTFHSDITQLAVFRDINIFFDINHVDMLTLSAHKLGGVPGCGLLFISTNVTVPSTFLLVPGTQQDGLRGGTINPGLVLAGLYALLTTQENRAKKTERLEALRVLLCRYIDGVITVGTGDYAENLILVNTGEKCATSVVRHMGTVPYMHKIVIVGKGSACSSGESHVFSQLPALDGISNVIRITYNDAVSKSDVQALLGSLRLSLL